MSNLRFVGAHRNHALFEARGKSILVNTKTLTASIVPDGFSEEQKSVLRNDVRFDPVWSEIAQAVLRRDTAPTSLTLSQSTKRTYSVPKKVALSAASGLEESPESPTAKYVATLLSSGEAISCADVLWVSRFFENHSEASTERSVWLSWGGEEGKRWSTALASRLDYDAVVADAGSYETPGVQDFVDGDESERTFWALLTEPLSRYASALFKLTERGTWQAWGNGDWVDCSEPKFSARFIELDDDCALYLAGALFDAPDTPVDLRAPNPDAWDIAEAAREEIDWDLIDRVIVAAGETGSPVTDGYTSEERSEDASSQLRDANGRFVEIGAQGAIKSTGIGGAIVKADIASGNVTVKADDGVEYIVPSSEFEAGAAPKPKVDPSQIDHEDLDLTGIVAEPKAAPEPKATLQDDLQILAPIEITEIIETYEAEVKQYRQEKSKDFKKMVEEGTLSLANETEGDTAPSNPLESNQSTPDNSDVDPVYLALVDQDDPRSVMELVALIPATAVTTEPKTFRRSGGKWVEDHEILRDIRSATPPPMVQLNAEQFEDVITQVDMGGVQTEPGESLDQTVTAAGGLDRNRGNAENLRRYWTTGPGGMKIRWKTGGDWTRCVRLLSKHLGPRAKGYCALRHKEMTGVWPGDRKNREMSSPALTASGGPVFSTDWLLSSKEVLRASADFASVEAARMRVYGQGYSPIPPSADDISEGRSGRAFRIPLLIPENLPTGDGRVFKKGSLGIRNLPIPLMWQIHTGSGHDGAVLVGKITRVERTSHGLGNAYGVFDTGPYGKEAQRLVEAGMLRWGSADLDKFEVDDDASDDEKGILVIKKGRLMGWTLVSKPAFQECTIELVPLEGDQEMPDAIPSTITASASIADSIPVEPPSVWFDRPVLNGPTPITVTDEGQVYGHIATWSQDHIGMNQVRPPRSASNYAYFHTGVLRTHDGKDVKVGQLTLAGGHAPLNADANAAVKHYDDTASAIADVHAGEDQYGIYVAGALRPGTTPEQIRAFRASAPSGDWRSINHRLELVAVCQVNVPGFPVPRAMTASAGEMTSLVAAGMAPLLELRAEQTREEQEALVASARDRMLKALRVDEYLTEFKDFSEEKRQALAKDGKALPDGSFPIENVADLRRAVQAYGRAGDGKKAKVRRHIVKRARALGKPDLIPSNWKEASLTNKALDYRDKYDALTAQKRAEQVEALRSRVFSAQSNVDLEAELAAIRKRIGK